VSRYQKGKTSLGLLEQEIVSGSGISSAICKCASRPRQITMPASNHSVFYRPVAIPKRPTNSVKALKDEPYALIVYKKHQLSLRNPPDVMFPAAYALFARYSPLESQWNVDSNDIMSVRKYCQLFAYESNRLHFCAKNTLFCPFKQMVKTRNTIFDRLKT